MLEETGVITSNRAAQGLKNVPAAITDVGCEREINEDRYAVIDSPLGKVWLVCDGMGGSLGGELAAQLAIDAIRRGLEAREYSSTSEALLAAVEEANRVIVLRRQNPAFSSMGTTIVAAMIQGDEVVIAHAGDSRGYLVRGGEIQQLTVDHTYVQELVDRGQISQDEALSHPEAHVLTRCLGSDPRLAVDCQNYWCWKAEEGEEEDYLILCSDGLYSLVTDEEISNQVSSKSPQEACVELVDLAKARGGYDNITLAILPIYGQLKEEEPPASLRTKVTKTHVVTKQKVQRENPLAELSLGKRMVLVIFLFLTGCLSTALMMMFALI